MLRFHEVDNTKWYHLVRKTTKRFFFIKIKQNGLFRPNCFLTSIQTIWKIDYIISFEFTLSFIGVSVNECLQEFQLRQLLQQAQCFPAFQQNMDGRCLTDMYRQQFLQQPVWFCSFCSSFIQIFAEIPIILLVESSGASLSWTFN